MNQGRYEGVDLAGLNAVLAVHWNHAGKNADYASFRWTGP